MSHRDLFETGIFSDIEIVLQDDIKQTPLKLHKAILYLNSSFFKCMLEERVIKLKETDQSTINVKVFDVDIATDIIKNFYRFGIPTYDWRSSLKYCIISKYFCLKYNLPKK
ncbi:BTB/POZ domain-containing protein [Cotonvirus japonicus]|uniref:BTB/POZ domain-containing protein n=1 Tax=Cotonvirus japonicus TaxID=2811091 RepID=A0ABM7NU75_9VIRU|nr:BTB/POZ domain-containing protein [Cotonvirus japonicus]BCS83734.1 BTB/POZ domain-containing protein [Cotonvirus japonicus]